MTWTRFTLAAWLGLVLISIAPAAPAPLKRPAREALKPFNDLIGSWRGTGTPEGTREEKQRGFWSETVTWSWQFKGDDAWLTATFDKGKYFTRAELRYPARQGRLPVDADRQGQGESGLRRQARRRPADADTRGRQDEGDAAADRQSAAFQPLFVPLRGEAPRARRCSRRSTRSAAPRRARSSPRATASRSASSAAVWGKSTVTYKGQTYYVCCGGCATPSRTTRRSTSRNSRRRRRK